ncbi:MAG: tetratricopeptide repeat protein [Terriglobia bacterium]
MSIYPDRDEIQGWVEWTRAHLPSEGDIPYLDWNGPAVDKGQSDDASSQGESAGQEEPPWVGVVPEILDETALGSSDKAERMLDAFAQAISADLHGLVPRFTALHFYYTLETSDWPEYSMYNKDLSAQVAFRRDLRTLVGMLKVDECPHDWRRIKWEISNALAIKDWGRAKQLFSLAEGIKATGESDLWTLRGQFNFFVALGRHEQKPRATSYWVLSLNPPGDFPGNFLALQAYKAALMYRPDGTLHGTLDEGKREMLTDARHDLGKAVQKRSDLDPSYHAMLGTCCFALGEYVRAADEYRTVLASGTGLRRIDFDILLEVVTGLTPKPGEDLLGLLKRAFSGDPSAVSWDFKPDLLRMLAKSYALAGKVAEAETVYRQWAQEYPNDPRVYRHLAELFQQEAKYKEAYEALLREVEIRPEAEQEPGYKLALALGAIAGENLDLDKVTRQALDAHPEVEKLFDSLLLDVWPTFGRLSADAREIWLFASVQTHYNPISLPALAPKYRQVGAEKFAKAVEIELRERTFEGFKKEVSGDVNITAAAERARNDPNCVHFAEFLVGKGPLTLLQMWFILREARAGRNELFRRLGGWTRQHFPRVGERLEDLKRIGILRNRETHEAASLDVREVPQLCRQFLDALLATAATDVNLTTSPKV